MTIFDYDVVIHIAGYLTDKQWIDAFKSKGSKVLPIAKAVEQAYSCAVIENPKYREMFHLDN